MKNKDFVAMILSHGRPNNVYTYKTLRNYGYTGDIIIVVDNEDKTIDEYKKNFDNVVVFNKQKIPFRSFEIVRRDEKALGELFCFFILETILLGKLLGVNPFDQPAVELIKKETKKILI